MPIRTTLLTLTLATLFIVSPITVEGQVQPVKSTEIVQQKKETPEDIAYQKTIAILEKTNEALNQRWTPINTIFASLAAVFAIVTLLWAGAFAYGVHIVSGIRKQREEMVTDAQNFKRDSAQVLGEINSKYTELKGKLDNGSKTAEEMEEELKAFRDNAARAIGNLENKALVTVSGVGGSRVRGTAYEPISFNPTGNLVTATVCSKCGTLFSPKTITAWAGWAGGESFMYDNIMAGVENSNLCDRCKKEKNGGVYMGTVSG